MLICTGDDEEVLREACPNNLAALQEKEVRDYQRLLELRSLLSFSSVKGSCVGGPSGWDKRVFRR